MGYLVYWYIFCKTSLLTDLLTYLISLKLNKCICKFANLKCTYILVRQVFKGDNYSREETINLLDFFSATSIQGRQLFKGGNYSRKYGNHSIKLKIFFYIEINIF